MCPSQKPHQLLIGSDQLTVEKVRKIKPMLHDNYKGSYLYKSGDWHAKACFYRSENKLYWKGFIKRNEQSTHGSIEAILQNSR